MNIYPFFTAVLSAALVSSCTHTATSVDGERSKYRKAASFTELVGAEVRNMSNERLGVVNFITADLENARLVEVVITPDQNLGSQSSLVAVPPQAMTLDKSAKVLRINVSRDRFAAAPKFTPAHMARATQKARVAEVSRYFGLEPWFYLDGQKPRKDAELLQMGHVRRTDQILRLPVANNSGQNLGHVGTLRMDLPKGQIIHVIVVTDAASGTRRVIQARALRYNQRNDGLILDESASEVAGEPSFRWLNKDRTSFQEETFIHQEVSADRGLHSRQNVAAGIVGRSTAVEEGDSFRDEEKTRQILRAIQADPTLSATAKGIEVSTLNAQITLRGNVNSAAAKSRIGAIAAAAGRPENVSNLLEVRP